MIPSLGLRDIASWPPIRNPDAKLPDIVADVPSLQRGLVWRPGQIELLWDSIMRGFPIGSLVIRRKLAADVQASRHAQDEARTTHHLLDGQQRAQAIKLAFEDPFDGRQASARSILWLDLTPANLGETRAFLFRVTTVAHPWGYLPADAANPVGIAKVRDSLRMCGSPLDDHGFHIRPKPLDCWPIVARTPVPFAWLISPCGDAGERTFWASVRSQCEGLLGTQVHGKWAENAINLLNGPPDAPALRAVWSGLERVRAAEVPLLELPEDAISSATAREETGPDRENVTNLENLFHRLNRGGTQLDGDDLAYSMIKAYWPGLDRTIAELAETRRLPEAKLVTVAARLPFAEAQVGQNAGNLVSSTVSVSKIRKLAQAESGAGEGHGDPYKRFRRFFDGDDVRGLHHLLKQVHRWCGPNFGHDLPLVLQTAIARGSPDICALLLWMADRALHAGGDDEADLGKPVQGLITALHWFALDKRAAAAVAARLEQTYPLSRDSFFGILAHAIDQNKVPLVRLPLPVTRLEAVLQQRQGDPNKWGWWTASREHENVAELQAAEAIINNTEMLLYAQRSFIRRRFASYDPAMEETWAQHNRPWDFDHILPRAAIDYVTFKNKDTVKEWALKSIANLRAWPMEDNRSDQRVSPETKVNDQSRRLTRNDVLNFSFLNEGELRGFGQGYEYTREGESSISGLEAYVEASRNRLVRIYSSWYEQEGLNIGYLTSGDDRARSPS